MPFHKLLCAQLSLCFVLSICLLGCSKNDTTDPVSPEKPSTGNEPEKVTYPKTLYLTDVAVKTVVKVYVGQTQLTDKAVIEKYISPSAPYYSDLFFLENKNLPNDPKSLPLVFKNADTAYYSNTTEKFKVTKTNSSFYFKSVVSLITPLPLIPNPEILKYPEIVKTSDNSGIQNTIMVGSGSYDEIKMSAISYKLYRYIDLPGLPPSRFGHSWVFHNNEFDSNVIKTLSSKDTLAIKEYTFTYKTK